MAEPLSLTRVAYVVVSAAPPPPPPGPVNSADNLAVAVPALRPGTLELATTPPLQPVDDALAVPVPLLLNGTLELSPVGVFLPGLGLPFPGGNVING